MIRSRSLQSVVFLALVSIAALSRLIDAAPNFAAVSAVALFAGVLFCSRLLALAVPVLAMLLSDCLIGFHDIRQMLVVYAMLALPIMLRTFAAPQGRPAFWRMLAAAGYCSIAFFLVTNLAVWTFGTMYSHDLNGLALCFERAWPFFRYTVAGDLAYTTALFGVFALLARPAGRPLVPAAA